MMRYEIDKKIYILVYFFSGQICVEGRDYTVRIKKNVTLLKKLSNLHFKIFRIFFMSIDAQWSHLSSAINKTNFCSRLGEHWLFLSRLWKMTCAKLKEEGEKSWHFWIVCQIKNVKHFLEICICMDGWRSHLSYDTKNSKNNSCLGEHWPLL